jgi:hypothetical protein
LIGHSKCRGAWEQVHLSLSYFSTNLTAARPAVILFLGSSSSEIFVPGSLSIYLLEIKADLQIKSTERQRIT